MVKYIVDKSKLKEFLTLSVFLFEVQVLAS